MAIWRTTVKLTFPRGSGGGTNTWHVRDPGTEVPSALSALSSYLEDFYSGMASALGSGYVVQSDGVFTTVDDPEDPEAVEIGGAKWTVNGTGSGFMDTQSMIVVGWRSSTPTRNGRGRTFIGPLIQGVIEPSNGTIAPPALANVQGLADDLVDQSLLGLNGAFVVWSPTENIARDLQSARVRDTFAHLSSRRGNA